MDRHEIKGTVEEALTYTVKDDDGIEIGVVQPDIAELQVYRFAIFSIFSFLNKVSENAREDWEKINSTGYFGYFEFDVEPKHDIPEEMKVVKEALVFCLEEFRTLGLTEASKLLEKLKELNNE